MADWLTDEHKCGSCSSGCTSRHTDESATDENKVAPYLVAAGLIIIVLSIVYRWLV